MALLAVLLAIPASARARDQARDQCCFKVQATVAGAFDYDYGSDPRNPYNGTGIYYWGWRYLTFVEFQGGSDPFLDDLGPPRETSSLGESTDLTKRRSGTTIHDSIACSSGQGDAFTTGKFVAAKAGGVKFSIAIDGHLDISATYSFNPRCDHGEFAHDPTQLDGEVPSTYWRAFALDHGAWDYDIPAGERKRYTQDRNFKVAFSPFGTHAPDPSAYSPHSATLDSKLEVRFVFVPRSELRKERKKLRGCKQGCELPGSTWPEVGPPI